MHKNRKRLLTALLCLAMCFALCVAVPQKAAADQQIGKILATTSYTPVALMDVSYITAATSTGGIYITDYAWYDLNNGTRMFSQFGTGQVEVEITFATHDGFEFADNVAVYLNNSPADYILSADHHYLTLTRVYAPMIWAPSVIKNPSDEWINEGGFASFVATALYVEGYQWHIVDPMNGREYFVEDITELFDIATSGDGESKLNLYNVPRTLDGWQVYCTFVGAAGGHSNSSRATLHVKYEGPLFPAGELEAEEEADPKGEDEADAAAEPSPEPTPESTPESTPEPTPAPAAEPEEDHTHTFPETWSFDDTYHWRECSCGERIEQGAHTMEWTVTRRAARKLAGEEHGVCTVCGYEAVRELPYEGPSTVLRFALLGVGGLVALTLIVLIADSIRTSIRRSRRKKARQKSRH